MLFVRVCACVQSGFITSKLAYIALLRSTTDLDRSVELMSGTAGGSSLQSEGDFIRRPEVGSLSSEEWISDPFQTSLNFLRWRRGIDHPGQRKSDRVGSRPCFASTVLKRGHCITALRKPRALFER